MSLALNDVLFLAVLASCFMFGRQGRPMRAAPLPPGQDQAETGWFV